MKNSKLKIEGFLNNKITGSQMKAIYGGDGDIIIDPPPIGGGPVSTGGAGSGTMPGSNTTTSPLPTSSTPLTVFVPPTTSTPRTNPNA
ncbi:MAG TPA: hypothetical protein VJL37_09100 [Flavobacterium sp.]|jgi:hypothetical protein|nr:hypothetical protein [Flavobacterium sp.]